MTLSASSIVRQLKARRQPTTYVQIKLDNGLGTGRSDFVDCFFFVNPCRLDIYGYSRRQDGVVTYDVSIIKL